MAISAASLIFERWCLTGLDRFRTPVDGTDAKSRSQPHECLGPDVRCSQNQGDQR